MGFSLGCLASRLSPLFQQRDIQLRLILSFKKQIRALLHPERGDELLRLRSQFATSNAGTRT